jgi:hypothetical protein
MRKTAPGHPDRAGTGRPDRPDGAGRRVVKFRVNPVGRHGGRISARHFMTAHIHREDAAATY